MSDKTDRCPTCGEPYTPTSEAPSERAMLCSNAFHNCVACAWDCGRIVEFCADCAAWHAAFTARRSGDTPPTGGVPLTLTDEAEAHIGEVAYRLLDGVFGTAEQRREYAERIAREAAPRVLRMFDQSSDITDMAGSKQEGGVPRLSGSDEDRGLIRGKDLVHPVGNVEPGQLHDLDARDEVADAEVGSEGPQVVGSGPASQADDALTGGGDAVGHAPSLARAGVPADGLREGWVEGLPSADAVREHEERTRAWCEERGLLYTSDGGMWMFRYKPTPGRQPEEPRFVPLRIGKCGPPGSAKFMEFRPCTPDGTPIELAHSLRDLSARTAEALRILGDDYHNNRYCPCSVCRAHRVLCDECHSAMETGR